MVFDLDLLADLVLVMVEARATALSADAIRTGFQMHDVCVVATHAVGKHVGAVGSSDLNSHSMAWCANVHLSHWLLVHAWGHIHASWVSLRVTAHHWLLLGISTHHGLLLRVAAHGLLLRVAAHHRLLLRIAAHHGLLLGVAAHWLLLGVAAHHGLLLGVAAHHWLLHLWLHSDSSADLSSGNLTISVDKNGLRHTNRLFYQDSAARLPD